MIAIIYTWGAQEEWFSRIGDETGRAGLEAFIDGLLTTAPSVVSVVWFESATVPGTVFEQIVRASKGIAPVGGLPF